MNIGAIRTCDVANGDGVRVTVFVSGCTLRCKGCFNVDCQSFSYGREFTGADVQSILKALESEWVAGLTILGGEPMEPVNQRGILPLIEAFRSKFRFTQKKTIWLYTGHILSKDAPCGKLIPVTDVTRTILENVDVVVDGPFVEELKDPSLEFRGSSNQRILKVPEIILEFKKGLNNNA